MAKPATTQVADNTTCTDTWAQPVAPESQARTTLPATRRLPRKLSSIARATTPLREIWNVRRCMLPSTDDESAVRQACTLGSCHGRPHVSILKFTAFAYEVTTVQYRNIESECTALVYMHTVTAELPTHCMRDLHKAHGTIISCT